MRQKNIVSGPADRLLDTTVQMNIGKKRVEWRFLTNVKKDEMDAVIQNWSTRTSTYTLSSLVEYINSKSDYGFEARLLPKTKQK